MSCAVVLVVAGVLSGQSTPPLLLQVRVFDGAEEVTAETRITVHRAGERGEPVGQVSGRAGRLELSVAPGIYDLQAIRERDGRVVNIRWAERLVVMPYPDEEGRHLEVVNFMNGYGALQIRQREIGGVPDANLYAPADHRRPAGARAEGTDYVLLVAQAGKYDVQTRTAGRVTWHRDIEVPLDRTRLWFVP